MEILRPERRGVRTNMRLYGKRYEWRICYAAAFLVLSAVEVLIAMFAHDRFVRPYIGDLLVVLVVYCFVRIWEPERWRKLPVWVFLFAAAVEVSQYFRLDRLLGLENFAPARIILGSTFDWADMGCYAVGCFLLGVWEFLFHRKSGSIH